MAKVRVYYKGLSDVREISKKHLSEAHGIDVSEDLVWSNLKPAINIDINDELLAVLKNEGTFKISEIQDDGTIGDDIVTATVKDDTVTAATVVDADTGQKSENPNAGKSKKGDK